MENIRRPALRYHGGKYRIAPWIIQQFPEHICYVEPFGGGGSVLLRKVPAKIEVYNDLNHGVVNFFQILRERPADLIAAIELTPYSRKEFEQAQEPCGDPLESARRFYVWSWQGRGRAGVNEPGGWRFMSRDTRDSTPAQDWNGTDHLWSIVRRLKQVHIECDDAVNVIKRFDDPRTLFYIDPPYVQSTRGKRWRSAAYSYEYTDDDHCNLARALHEIRGMAIVSGYPSNLYNDLYNDWRVTARPSSKDNGIRKTTEVLWMNKNVPEKERRLF